MRPDDAVYIGFIAGFMTAWKILPAVGKLLKSGFGVRPWTRVCGTAATALATLQSENARLRAEPETKKPKTGGNTK